MAWNLLHTKIAIDAEAPLAGLCASGYRPGAVFADAQSLRKQNVEPSKLDPA